MTFNEIISKVNMKWSIQQSKAEKAEKLLTECEKLEIEMIKLLDQAGEEYPEEYMEYLQSFGPFNITNKNIDS